ncbi:type II secretion system protein [Enterobacterales bacterium BD_CKDN230030183-1A_HGKHYDSX7]
MNTQRGFTLLEMLAAITLLVLATSILVGAFAQSSRSLRQVERSDRHAAVARSLMDDFDLGTLRPGHSSGSWQGVHWALDVSLDQAIPGQLVLYRLDLELTEGQHTSHYRTLRARSEGIVP